MIKKGMRPVHPGEILREDYLKPLGMNVNALARALHVPPTRLHAIVNQRRAITLDTALRLARYFGSDARSWLNLQAEYDLKIAEIEKASQIAGTKYGVKALLHKRRYGVTSVGQA